MLTDPAKIADFLIAELSETEELRSFLRYADERIYEEWGSAKVLEHTFDFYLRLLCEWELLKERGMLDKE